MKEVRIVVLDGFTASGQSSEPVAAVGASSSLSADAWHDLRSLGHVTVYDRTDAGQTLSRAMGADVLLTNKVVLDRALLSSLRGSADGGSGSSDGRLRYVGVLATGYNVVDVAAAHELGITVTNVPAYSTESVAQMVFAHLLNVTNRIEHYAVANRGGRWSASPDFCYWDSPLPELAGKTMGIVGLGNIGSRVAAIAQAFGMRVKAVTSKAASALPRGVESVGMDELLRSSDVVTLHCPLTPSTHHLIDASALRLAKPTAIVINTGRGPLVDEAAVAAALREGRIAAFCADVMVQEPPSCDNVLLRQPNAFVTPHIAWATTEARSRLIAVATSNVAAFLSGKPQNTV